ncbi:hypothetical protein BN1184_CH_00420 [Pantoea ananatis]|nr:hypothetical protein BN1184_CH_00420 [Pantoea ananatis]
MIARLNKPKLNAMRKGPLVQCPPGKRWCRVWSGLVWSGLVWSGLNDTG